MPGKGFVLKFSEGKRGRFLFACAVVAFCFAQTIAAQSGRRSGKSVELPKPPAAVEPATGAQTIKSSVVVSSIVVVGEEQHDYAYYRSSYLDSALKECVNSLKARPQAALDVAKGGKMSLKEATERAKKETNTFVLWMGFVSVDNGYGDMTIDYIEYALLTPQTAKALTSGRVSPADSVIIGQGGVMRLPSRPKRPSALSQMKAGVREIAGNLIHGGWL